MHIAHFVRYILRGASPTLFLISLFPCVCPCSPCSLLLSTVSGEGVKERSDRVLLAPWVKFLWESYRNMLELLKNNNTIERLYAEVAKEGV